MSATTLAMDWRRAAASLVRARQNASSSETLVLCPAMTRERLTTPAAKSLFPIAPTLSPLSIESAVKDLARCLCALALAFGDSGCGAI